MKKYAVITGAGKGIGKAITLRMVEDGYFVLMLDVEEEPALKLERELGSDKVKFYPCDISDEENVTSLFDQIKKEYSSVDVLVNNAGILKDNVIWKMSSKEFEEYVDKVKARG